MFLLLNFPFADRIGGLMISVFASIVVDCGFEHRSGQTKHYKIDICGFCS